MPKHPRNHPRKTKPPNTPKKVRNDAVQRGRIPDEDKPQVGDIWKITYPHGDEYKAVYYLLTAEARDEFFRAGDGTFDMLHLESGETIRMYMNFELDEWQFVA